MNVVLIGAGNLAYHLALQLHRNFLSHHSTHHLTVVNHRHSIVLEDLEKTGITCIASLKDIPSDADIYMIAVKDTAIEEVRDVLKHKVHSHAVVVHTSGAITSDVLNNFEYYGVFYPLYSFSLREKNIVWQHIPVFYIAHHIYVKEKLSTLVQFLNPQCFIQIDDDLKLRIHILAVFANNFINALLHSIYVLVQNDSAIQSYEIYQYVLSFAKYTIQRVQNDNPAVFQTGPAIRFDNSTIEKHLLYLKQYPDIQKLYFAFTEYIQSVIYYEQHKK